MSSQIDFSAIGNYRTITYDKPFDKVTSIRGYVADTENEVPDYSFLYYEFRWSINGDNWSLWIEMTTNNLSMISLNPDNPFYLEFRVTAKSNEYSTPHIPIGGNIDPPILLNDIEPDLVYLIIDQRNFATKPKVLCSNEKYDKPVIFNPNCINIFNPYAVNNGINMAQDLSYTVNSIFGREVQYYSVQPNGRGRDIILREYNLFDVVDEKCLKILVDKNEFGDGKPVYDSFGTANDPLLLEVHIDKKYFESFFGKGAQPRRRDIIYFPLTNKIYRIETTYIHRDFNYAPIFFKCQLSKYEKNMDTNWNDSQKESELNDYTVSAETLFKKETEDEIKKSTKPQQYYVSSQKRNEDPVRSYISNNLPIIEYDLNNNWTIVFNSYYDLETLNYDNVNEAVRYNASPVLTTNDELSYSCWFKIRNFIDKTKLVPKAPRILPITLVSQTNGVATYTTYPLKNVLIDGGYVAISGGTRSGGYKILDLNNDGYQFTIFDDGTPIIDTTNWKMQKAEARTLINGYNNNTGLSIEIIWSGTSITGFNYLQIGSFRILINNKEILSPFGTGITGASNNFIPNLDDWYGFVFNFSNVFNQYSINVWGLSYDATNPSIQSGDLILLHTLENFIDHQIFSFPVDLEENHDNPTWHTDNNSYKLTTSPIYITNIRLFKSMIALEKQSALLNQNIIQDSQLAIIIDNAKPVLSLPKFVRNR